jgi:hypothetical protein
MTVAEYEAWVVPAFARAVMDASKTTAKRLGADAVYAVGEEVAALRLFSIEEMETKARSMARGGRAQFDAVRELAVVCFEVHGRTFDAEGIIAEALSA